MTAKAQWHRLEIGVLPPDGVEIDSVMEARICRAIGDAIGPWTMIYGFKAEIIPPAERQYPMASKPGPFSKEAI